MNDIDEESKLTAMAKSGATREAAYNALVRGLTSKKMTIDKFGDEHFEDDTASQIRSAEIISRMNGDMKADIAIDNRRVNINMVGINKEMVEGLMAMALDVKEQLAQLRVSGQQTGEIIDIQ